jgi:hypothetical protein
VAAALWLGFSGLTLLILLAGLDHSARHPKTMAATVAGTVLGPMTGAICRDRGWVSRTLRVVAWAGGLVVWFGGGIVSFGHALS